MADNDILIAKIFDAIEDLNKIKNTVEKTDLKITHILNSLDKQEYTIKEHIVDIASIKKEIEYIKEDIANMKLDIESYEYHNNNIYYKLRQIENKENKYRKIKIKINKMIKTVTANKYTIAVFTSIVLAIIFLLAKSIITYTGDYFGIEKSIIDSFHDELDNNR